MKTKSEFEKWLESPEALRCMNTLELLGENTRTTCIFQLAIAFAAGERKGERKIMNSQRMYPIQDGPSVPYEVMVPYEAQCQRNHSQSIDRIAERSGFSCLEAWCVVNGMGWYDMQKTIGHEEARRQWVAYAERINLHYAALEDVQARLAAAERKGRIAGLREADGLVGWRGGHITLSEMADRLEREEKAK